MKIIKHILCGILMGLANIIPGFSGGTMILILGIYEYVTENIANVTKTPLKSLKALWAIGLGLILGIIIGTFTIKYCIDYFPLITASFFAGLTIFTIIVTIKEIKNLKVSIPSIIGMIICFGVSMLLCFAEKFGLVISIDDPNILTIILVVIIAVIVAATMIVPAASGSLVLLSLGLYEPIISKLKDTFNMFVTGNFTGIGNNLLILIPYAIGLLAGLVLMSKLITYLFKHYANIIWFSILGLLFSAVFTVYYNTYKEHIAPNPEIVTSNLPLQIILSVVFLGIGIFGSLWLLKIANKKKENNNK